jgi:hypothetical protein
MTTAGINSARSYAWSGLWNFVDRKVDAVFTVLFRLHRLRNGTVTALKRDKVTIPNARADRVIK